MKKHFVPYDESLALANAGFQEGCMRYYHTDKTLRSSSEGWLNETCAAPLYAQAFEWFRKEFDLHGVVDFEYLKDSESFYYGFIRLKSKKAVDLIGDNATITSSYGKYEDAQLALLNKLIHIIKNNRQ